MNAEICAGLVHVGPECSLTGVKQLQVDVIRQPARTPLANADDAVIR